MTKLPTVTPRRVMPHDPVEIPIDFERSPVIAQLIAQKQSTQDRGSKFAFFSKKFHGEFPITASCTIRPSETDGWTWFVELTPEEVAVMQSKLQMTLGAIGLTVTRLSFDALRIESDGEIATQTWTVMVHVA